MNANQSNSQNPKLPNLGFFGRIYLAFLVLTGGFRDIMPRSLYEKMQNGYREHIEQLNEQLRMGTDQMIRATSLIEGANQTVARQEEELADLRMQCTILNTVIKGMGLSAARDHKSGKIYMS